MRPWHRLPFGLRVSMRRLPALARWRLSPPQRLKRGDPADFPVVQCSRSSPLRRQGTRWPGELQQAKEHNVAWAARGLHAVVIPPGGTLSWHDELGPPLKARGVRDGPELHDGEVALGGGGGACQVANLVTWLAATAGLDVVKRHRHGWDLFPDDQRTVPFGLGATVFWPWHDLVLRNPHDQPVQLRLWLDGGNLRGEAAFVRPTRRTWRVEEIASHFEQREDEVIRHNRLERICEQDGRTISREPWASHEAVVRYAVGPEALEEP